MTREDTSTNQGTTPTGTGEPGDPSPAEFSVVFSGEVMEPIADVAPEGEVTFVLINHSETPQGFAIVDVDRRREGRPARPLEPQDPGVVACEREVEPGGSRATTYRLTRGRYMLVSNTHGSDIGTGLFDLTVQPVDGA